MDENSLASGSSDAAGSVVGLERGKTPKKASNCQAYSLFAVGDGVSTLWQACNTVISTVSEPLQASTLDPATDPRVSFSPKAPDLPHISGLRELCSNTSRLSHPADSVLLPALDHPSLVQHSDLQHGPSSCRGIASGHGQHSLLQPPHLTFEQQLGLCSTAMDIHPAQQQLPAHGRTPEHARQMISCCAEATPSHMSPHGSTQLLGPGLHSPVPSMRPCWAGAAHAAITPTPPSPADAGLVCTLFVPAHPPPPPPRAANPQAPPPPPPPPPPRRRGSSSSGGPGTPNTPGSAGLQPFGIGPSPLQSQHQPGINPASGGAVPAFGPAFHTNPSSQAPTAGPAQYDVAARVAALLSPSAPGGCVSTQPGSAYGRLLQGAFSCDAGGKDGSGLDPFVHGMPAPLKVNSSDVLGQGPDQQGNSLSSKDDLAAAMAAAYVLPKLSADPVTPTAPVALLTASGRRPVSGSRLVRNSSSSSSSSSGSFRSGDSLSRETSLGGAAQGPSRLSNSAAGNMSRMGSGACASGPCATSAGSAPAKPAVVPSARLMFMEMHDHECSSYCLGGTLEPHKMWFGVGVHRAIRKLVTNNKRRHSLILALHAAGDGSGYGDLGKVYGAVKSMHDGLAAGTGWNSEAGAKLFAGVEELKELLERALMEGPGIDDYQPPAFLLRSPALPSALGPGFSTGM